MNIFCDDFYRKAFPFCDCFCFTFGNLGCVSKLVFLRCVFNLTQSNEETYLPKVHRKFSIGHALVFSLLSSFPNRLQTHNWWSYHPFLLKLGHIVLFSNCGNIVPIFPFPYFSGSHCPFHRGNSLLLAIFFTPAPYRKLLTRIHRDQNINVVINQIIC